MDCGYVKSDGGKCKANAIKGSNLCINHNPEYKEVKSLAVYKGGLNRRHSESYGSPIVLKAPSDIKDLLGLVINKIWCGEMPSNQPANSIGFLARCWLDAHEKGEIETRLLEIEKRLEVRSYE